MARCVLCGCREHRLIGCAKHIAKKCSCHDSQVSSSGP